MLAKNMLNFLPLLINAEKQLHFHWDDDILSACVLTHNGEIRHPAFKKGS